MTKILFPTDFSEAAEKAFLYALELTQKLNAELILLHVYELPELGRALQNTTREVYELMEMESLENFKKSVSKLRDFATDKGYNDVDFKHLMAEGEAVYTITEAAKRESIDYIVMGTKGASGLKEVFLGSVASGVIDSANCSVISVPQQTDYKEKLDRIAYLTNYTEKEIESFNTIAKFAKHFDAKINCIHFDEDAKNLSSQQMEDWKSKLDPQGVEVKYNIISGSNFEETLADFYNTNGIDIVAIQPRKRNFFVKIFSRGVSKKLAHHIEIPLFTLPAK
jgi:nucleotide-binding universal stress UspA family protein